MGKKPAVPAASRQAFLHHVFHVFLLGSHLVLKRNKKADSGLVIIILMSLPFLLWLPGNYLGAKFHCVSILRSLLKWSSWTPSQEVELPRQVSSPCTGCTGYHSQELLLTYGKWGELCQWKIPPFFCQWVTYSLWSCSNSDLCLITFFFFLVVLHSVMTELL